jgi:phosphatidylserine decarboxylase
MSYPHPIIAREGWPFVLGTLVLAILVLYFGGWWSLPFWIIAVFVLQFFRDPKRAVPTRPSTVLAPADGRIVAIEATHDPYANRPALKISVFMNVFNVHSNRSPIDGKISRIEYFPGGFINAALDKASLKNERNAIIATTVDGHEVTFVQVAGLIARRILCYVKVGDELKRGQRYGFIRFGSRVDVYLPAHARALASVGQKVWATTSVLAEL